MQKIYSKGKPMDKDALNRMLNKAKVSLMADHNSVFITTVLFSLKFSWDESIPTACTNGLNLRVNPNQFKNDLSHPQRVWQLAHESWHVAYQHINRVGTRDFKTWNIAADHVINLMLEEQGYAVPDNRPKDPKFKGMSTEQVYEIIYNDPSYDDSDFELDFEHDPDLSPDEQAELDNEIENILVKAHVQSQMSGSPGKLPGEVEVYLDKLLNPKLPWEQILANFLVATAPDDYSFRKPNRRYMPDYYLPSLHSDGIGEIAVAVDTSGSVSDEEFLRFITEVQAIQTRMNPTKMTVIDFDYEIRDIHTVHEGKDVKNLKFSGRGGTYIKPVLEWAKKNKPIALLVFTDGEFDTININPDIPVIWVIHANEDFTYPFGRVITYEI